MQYHSKHTFMFPFHWEINNKRKSRSYNDKTSLRDFCRLFESENKYFRKTPFVIEDSAEKYNEYSYFYAFVRNAIYYTDDDNLLRYYELDEPNGEFNIEILTENGIVTKSLTLDSICLHVFETGIGVVTFNMTNFNYADEESILAINEYGRRLYPQFMASGNRMMAKNSFLPNRIYGKIGDFSFDEDFSQYNDALDVDSVFLPPDYIKKVFGYKGQEKLGDIDKKFVFTKQDENKDTIRIRLITDDRMFFICWYGNNKVVEELTHYEEEGKKGYGYQTGDFWYELMFGDKKGGISIQDDRLKKQEIDDCTYTRWLGNHEYHTLYGITKDSFVVITNSKIDLGVPVDVQLQSMYYQMAILCLVQRASILRFGWEITQITNLMFKDNKKTSMAIKELYENYLRFINQVYFREVTSQIQGVELYNLFQKKMNIEKEAKDLDGEMQEIFNYLSVQEQSELGEVANLFLPVTLLAGILGINTIGFKQTQAHELYNVFSSVSYFVTVILFGWTICVFLKLYIYEKFCVFWKRFLENYKNK